MKIEEVITEVVIAVYGSPQLAKLLILKGGSAMRMLDGQDSRLSLDADFSIKDMLTDADPIFLEMERCFAATFSTHGFDLIDFKAKKKPKKLQQGFPAWWGGWACDFKLVDRKPETEETVVREPRTDQTEELDRIEGRRALPGGMEQIADHHIIEFVPGRQHMPAVVNQYADARVGKKTSVPHTKMLTRCINDLGNDLNSNQLLDRKIQHCVR